jgi:hypothetical protein
LEIHDLTHGNGFTLIQTNYTQLISSYRYIIHTVNLTEYERNIELIKSSLNLTCKYSPELLQEFDQLQKEYLTLIPHSRVKRGLINVLGTGFKYLYGIMDDNDRKDIENHFKYLQMTNTELIKNNNNQITINDKMTKQLQNISSSINQSNKKITNKINEFYQAISQFDQEIYQLHFEILIRKNMNTLINEIQKLKEIILMSRLNILSRDILTYDEIIDNNITLDELSEIQLRIAMYNSTLLLILSVPNYETTLYANIIIEPVPNKNDHLQLIPKVTRILSLNNILYYPTKYKKQLNKINDKCIQTLFQNPIIGCKFETNTETFVKTITENIALIVNSKDDLIQNCSTQNIQLNGTYLLKFENCQIQINQTIISNKNYVNHLILPNVLKEMTKLVDVSNITLEQIHFQNINNLDKITDVQYTHTQYRNSSFIVISLLLCIIIGSSIIYYKQRKVHLQIYQPVVELKKGRVMITEPKHEEEPKEMHPFGQPTHKIFS